MSKFSFFFKAVFTISVNVTECLTQILNTEARKRAISFNEESERVWDNGMLLIVSN